uniref:RRM domain-containing protein n=1 Tax=Setaria digitata TaxID=48799 RepID=A0A915PK20_9BILA
MFESYLTTEIMATTALPQISNSALTAQQLNLLGAASTAVSTHLTGNTSSPICSTSVVMFNSGCQPLLQYMHLTNQYTQPVPMLSTATNVFEGVPIFLLPQSSSSSSTSASHYNSYQRTISEAKANLCPRSLSPKVDTSSMFKIGRLFEHFHVFVGDLATKVDNCTLKAAFESFGEISSPIVNAVLFHYMHASSSLLSLLVMDGISSSCWMPRTSHPTALNAEKAIEEMNGKMIGRRQIRTNWAVRRLDGGEENAVKAPTYDDIFNATHASNTSVYVGGIPPATTEEELMQLFSAIATVTEVRLFKQQGYAFIRYLNKESATRAIMLMNGKEINGQKIRCSWGRTTVDNNSIISNQAVGGMNLLANNIIGFNPLINPVPWSQNQCLPQFCGHPLLYN